MWLDPVSKQLLASAPTQRPIVLTYHSVTNKQRQTDSPWSVTLKDFMRQMDLLKDNGWTTIRIIDFLTPQRLPSRAVAITFDDGYCDNLDACEQLQARGLTATWFIVSGSVGKTVSWQDPDAPACKTMLSGAELRAMISQGFEIGAHGQSHRRLTKLDAAELREETLQPKQALQDLLGCPITSFAYPYGDYDDRIVAAVKEAGYSQACTCMTGWALKNTDLLRLRRIPVLRTDTPAGFVRKLVFADSDYGWFRLVKYYMSRLGSR